MAKCCKKLVNIAHYCLLIMNLDDILALSYLRLYKDSRNLRASPVGDKIKFVDHGAAIPDGNTTQAL